MPVEIDGKMVPLAREGNPQVTLGMRRGNVSLRVAKGFPVNASTIQLSAQMFGSASMNAAVRAKARMSSMAAGASAMTAQTGALARVFASLAGASSMVAGARARARLSAGVTATSTMAAEARSRARVSSPMIGGCSMVASVGATSATTSLASLFANGEAGDEWLMEKDHLYTKSSSGAIEPVTTTGDLVFRATGLHNGINADQDDSNKRPVYQEGGGLSWIETDGVDDTLGASGVISATDPVHMFVVGSTVSTQVNRGFVVFNVNSDVGFSQRAIAIENGSTLKVDARNFADVTITTDMSIDSVFEGRFSASGVSDGIYGAVNGGGFSFTPKTLVDTTGDFSIGEGLTAEKIDAKVYAVFARNAFLTFTQRQNAVDYFGSKAGISV